MTQAQKDWLDANLDRINALAIEGESPKAIAKALGVRPCRSGISIDRRYLAILEHLEPSPEEWLEPLKGTIAKLKADGLTKKQIMEKIGLKKVDRLSIDPKSVILSKYLKRLERKNPSPKPKPSALTLREQLGICQWKSTS